MTAAPKNGPQVDTVGRLGALARVVIALVGTVALALLVLFLPVRRAVRFRPGDALRYA
jgi:hypothetical protein